MSSSMRKSSKKEAKQLSVTTRCVAIVFKNVDSENRAAENETVDDQLHVELHAEYNEKDKSDGKEQNECVFDGKAVLEEFKFRNKTCYWNPALVDSIKSLEYVGYIEPLTILVKGDDIHLENVRTAWGRRVLKDPAKYRIDRIGDVNGIEMKVVPQTQFIPLPEALCLVIMDLNNRQILATLDTVSEKLKGCYQGLHLPSNQLVYETLGTLIRERKVFHTGCGYFVVTPDTFRFHGDDTQSTMFAPWTHLHPMYIPAIFSQPLKPQTRSISCQVDAEDNMIGPTDFHDRKELSKEMPVQRSQRSMSFSVRRSRDRNKKDEVMHSGSLRRSSSVKGRNEKENRIPTEETISEPVVKTEKLKKEKISLFSKLFGRNKKKSAPEPKKQAVEYASFSAQFPPPEWMWYQQQLDKQVRTETWVQQQIVKSGTWHHLNSLPTELGHGSIYLGANSVPDRNSPFTTATENTNHNFVPSGHRRTHRKSHRSKARSPLVIVNSPSDGDSPLDLGMYQTHRTSMGQPSIRLSSLPTRLSQANDAVRANYVTHPMLNSTPRVPAVSESYRQEDLDSECIPVSKHEKGKSKKPHKSRKSKLHTNKHSSHHSNVRHVSGMSSNLNSNSSPHQDEADISMHYHGEMPEKYSSLGMSRSSGVNCMDIENDETRSSYKGHRSHRSRSHMQSYTAHANDSVISRKFACEGEEHLYQNSNPDQRVFFDSYSRQTDLVDAHIYANVHITNTESVKPKLPERTHKRIQKERGKDYHCDTISKQTVADRYSVDGGIQEHDRLSENNSEQGTVQSNSSQEHSSQDSAVDGTESSEHSLNTVIDTQSVVNKHFDKVLSHTEQLSLADSGFSSPRGSEQCDNFKKEECNLNRKQHSFTCNNLKLDKNATCNSVGKLDDLSDETGGRITSDTLYENVKLNQNEVLNNMKYLHKEINVSSQNLNMPQTSHESGNGKVDFDPKQPVLKKFNFEGDFHVVGVV